jgi:hypothetical protein
MRSQQLPSFSFWLWHDCGMKKALAAATELPGRLRSIKGAPTESRYCIDRLFPNSSFGFQGFDNTAQGGNDLFPLHSAFAKF